MNKYEQPRSVGAEIFIYILLDILVCSIAVYFLKSRRMYERGVQISVYLNSMRHQPKVNIPRNSFLPLYFKCI